MGCQFLSYRTNTVTGLCVLGYLVGLYARVPGLSPKEVYVVSCKNRL